MRTFRSDSDEDRLRERDNCTCARRVTEAPAGWPRSGPLSRGWRGHPDKERGRERAEGMKKRIRDKIGNLERFAKKQHRGIRVPKSVCPCRAAWSSSQGRRLTSSSRPRTPMAMPWTRRHAALNSNEHQGGLGESSFQNCSVSKRGRRCHHLHRMGALRLGHSGLANLHIFQVYKCGT